MHELHGASIYVLVIFLFPSIKIFTSTCTMRSSRASHLATQKHGQHYTSPQKARDKKKTTTRVTLLGQTARKQQLLLQLRALETKTWSIPPAAVKDSDIDPEVSEYIPDPTENTTTVPSCQPPSSDTPVSTSRRILPDPASHRLYDSWKCLIPTLLAPLLDYLNRSHACLPPQVGDIRETCQRTDCPIKSVNIICLYFDRKLLLSWIFRLGVV
jgi:hypothetical protein